MIERAHVADTAGWFLKLLKKTQTKMLKKYYHHKNFFIIFFILICSKWEVFCAEETPPWMNELFGDGSFDEDAVQYIEKHLSRQKNLKFCFLSFFHSTIVHKNAIFRYKLQSLKCSIYWKTSFKATKMPCNQPAKNLYLLTN